MEETTQPEQATSKEATKAEEGAQPEETTKAEAQPESAQPADTTPLPEGTMRLGGGIELTGFSGIEKAHLVVVKKVVGNSAKEMSEKAKKFEKLAVTLTKEGDNVSIHAELTDEGKQITADSTESNLFTALSAALKEVIDKQATS